MNQKVHLARNINCLFWK